ncbi:hypothetical protein HMN09_00774100 [Mycena chlorophos]|uniref:Uncharacterized protein n=1 Tax=Mycena chlorophos TaxID=658473 RepID=A0A8H6W4B9_MYCCL|nr:hypothetical protein HMN09_00774100 [Mycena chlorophos]
MEAWYAKWYQDLSQMSVPFNGIPLAQGTAEQNAALQRDLAFMTTMHNYLWGDRAPDIPVVVATDENTACLPWRPQYPHKMFALQGTDIHILIWGAPWAPECDFQAQLVLPGQEQTPLDPTAYKVEAQFCQRITTPNKWEPLFNQNRVYLFMGNGLLRFRVSKGQWTKLEYRERDYLVARTARIPGVVIPSGPIVHYA